MRSFKLAITGNAYVLIAFMSGLESCAANAGFFVPSDKKTEDLRDRVEMVDLDPPWIHQFFEKALDRFVDAYLESLGDKRDVERELITAL